MKVIDSKYILHIQTNTSVTLLVLVICGATVTLSSITLYWNPVVDSVHKLKEEKFSFMTESVKYFIKIFRDGIFFLKLIITNKTHTHKSNSESNYKNASKFWPPTHETVYNNVRKRVNNVLDPIIGSVSHRTTEIIPKLL